MEGSYEEQEEAGCSEVRRWELTAHAALPLLRPGRGWGPGPAVCLKIYVCLLRVRETAKENMFSHSQSSKSLQASEHSNI